MSNQIKKKFIADNAIDGDKIELLEGQALRQNGQDLIKLDAEGKVQIPNGEVAVKADIDSLQTQTSKLANSIVSYQQTYLSSILTQVEVDQGYLDFSEDNKVLVQKSTKVFLDRLAIHPELDYKLEDLENNQYRLHFIKEMYNGVNATDIEGSAKAPSEEAPEAGDTITLYFQVYTPVFLTDSNGDGSLDFIDTDTDGDGVNDSLDAFPNDPLESVDSDGDGIGDNADNAINTPNPDQSDIDNDGIGDVIDSDIDGDGVANELDALPEDPAFSNSITRSPSRVWPNISILNGHLFVYVITGFEDTYDQFLEDTIFTLRNSEGLEVSGLKFSNVLDSFYTSNLAYQNGIMVSILGDLNTQNEKKAILDQMAAYSPSLTILW